jgi:hypothetical protein
LNRAQSGDSESGDYVINYWSIHKVNPTGIPKGTPVDSEAHPERPAARNGRPFGQPFSGQMRSVHRP